MTEGIDDELISGLRPFFDRAREMGSEILGDIGSDLGEKAAGGLTDYGIKATSAFGRAIKNRFDRRRAKGRLGDDLAEANTDAERELALRRYLSADPTLRKSLATIVERRNYLGALAEICDDLPVTELVSGHHRLSHVFIPPDILGPEGSHQASPRPASPTLFGSDADHLILGDAGSGKSSLARWLTIASVRSVLTDENSVALDQLRLSVYLSAADLQDTNWTDALHHAVSKQLGLRGVSRLTPDFFDPGSDEAHRLWTICIDGFDEIDDEARRHAIFRTVMDLRARGTDNFRFMLFARPGSLPPADDKLQVWRIAALADAQRLIDRYVSSPDIKAKLSDLLARPDYREIARNPLFVAMSATLFESVPELPTRSHALIEAFVERGVEFVARGSSERHDALMELLSKIAATPQIGRNALLSEARSACKELSKASATIRIMQDVDQALRNTGLLRVSASGEYRFLHRLIDRHLFAIAMAATETPDSAIWHRLDPSRIGWAGVEQLCVHWAESGVDVGATIAALADFGDIGRDTSLRLAIQLPSVPDEPFERAFDDFASSFEEGDVDETHHELLPRLARLRPTIRNFLIRLVTDEWASLETGSAARALAEAGYFEPIRERLLEMALNEEGETSGLSDVADVLLENGEREAALDLLRSMSETGFEAYERLDAACQLYAAERTRENLFLLRQIVEQDFEEAGEEADSLLIDRLFETGEHELALPLLRRAAAPPSQSIRGRDFDDRVAAARRLDAYRPGEGLEALDLLLVHPGIELRQQAEILAAIDAIRPDGDARRRLRNLTEATPLQTDWRVVDILLDWNLDDVAWNAGRALILHQFAKRRFDVDGETVLERIAMVTPTDQVEALIRTGLATCASVDLVEALTLVEKGHEARSILEAMLGTQEKDIAIEAAVTLAGLGGRPRALDWLFQFAIDDTANPELRMDACEAMTRIAETDAALAAWLNIVDDDRHPMALRVKAARSYSNHSRRNDAPAIRALENAACQESLPVEDRLQALLSAHYLDVFQELMSDPEDIFHEIVGESDIEARHILPIAKLADALEVDPAELPGFVALLVNANTPASAKIIGAGAIHPFGPRGDFAADILSAIALDRRQSWKDRHAAVCAMQKTSPALVENERDAICFDSAVPPKWRLLAAHQWRIDGEFDRDLARLRSIKQDESVDIASRFKAYESALEIGEQEPFPDFASMNDLDTLEHIQIANAALKHNRPDIARERLAAALPLQKTAHELVSLHKLAIRLDDANSADRLRRDAAKLKLEALVHLQDSDTIIDTIDIVTHVDPDMARDRLQELIASPDLAVWNLADCLDRLAKLTSREHALVIGGPIIDELVADVLADTISPISPVSVLKAFYDRGWTKDPEPLHCITNDPLRRFSERVGAATLAFRSCDIDYGEARATLNALLGQPHAPGEAIAAAYDLLQDEFTADAQQLALGCLHSELSPTECVTLAEILERLSYGPEASKLIRDLAPQALADAFLYSPERGHASSVLGEEVFAAMKDEAVSRSDDVMLQVQEASKRVSDEGDSAALAFLIELASKSEDETSSPLDAIERLDELGFRKLARDLFDQCDKDAADPFWVANVCDRFGRFDEALKFYRRANEETEPANEHLIAQGLADHGAADEIRVAETM